MMAPVSSKAAAAWRRNPGEALIASRHPNQPCSALFVLAARLVGLSEAGRRLSRQVVIVGVLLCVVPLPCRPRYALNVWFNLLNKSIFKYFPFPYTVSTVHVIVGTAYCALVYFMGLKKWSFGRVSRHARAEAGSTWMDGHRIDAAAIYPIQGVLQDSLMALFGLLSPIPVPASPAKATGSLGCAKRQPPAQPKTCRQRSCKINPAACYLGVALIRPDVHHAHTHAAKLLLLLLLSSNNLDWPIDLLLCGRPASQPVTKQEFGTIFGPAFMHAIGHIAANISFAAVAISLTHTVKTLEPAFNVLLSRCA